MTRPRKDAIYHITDGEWVKWDDGTLECCDCGLVHGLKSELRDGVLYVRVTRDEKETRAARIRRARKGERP
jgi:hypothetical protein